VRFLKTHLLLLLSLLVFAVGGLLVLGAEPGPVSASEIRYLAGVQQRVIDELRQSETDLLAVEARFSLTSDTSFSRLLIPTHHPYFIFRNGRLVFWSDHRFVPAYRALAGLRFPGVLAWEESRFLVSRRVMRQSPERVEAISLIPLFRTYGIENQNFSSGYNPAIFGLKPQSLRLTPVARPFNLYAAPGTPNESFLFSLETPAPELLRHQSVPNLVLGFWALALVLLGAYGVQWLWAWRRQRRYEIAFLALAGYLLLARVVMIYFGIPFTFRETALFNPALYASSVVTPSLGDLLLNVAAGVVLLLYAAVNYFRSRWYRRLVEAKPLAQAIVSVVLVSTSYALYDALFRELNGLYTHSRYALDLKLSLTFYREPLRLAALGAFVLLSAQYFLALHLLVGLFARLNRNHSWRVSLGWLAVGTLLALGVAWAWRPEGNPFSLLLNGMYFAVLYTSGLPQSLYSFRYQTSVYFFTGAVVCALTGAWVVYGQELNRDFSNKQVYGQEFLAENDKYGEFLLYRMNREIRGDTAIAQLFTDPNLPRERVLQRIRERHLRNYFDSYDVSVVLFDPAGNPIGSGPESPRYDTLVQRYRQPRYQTAYPDLYFVSEPRTLPADSLYTDSYLKQYVDFVGIPAAPADSARALRGTLVLDLTLRDLIPQRPYSELLVDAQHKRVPEAATEYGYAIYDSRGRLISSAGLFNYEKRFPLQLLREQQLYTEGLTHGAFRHVGLAGANGRRIVVSSGETTFGSYYSGFSFLFLVLVVGVITLVLGYAVRYAFTGHRVNFTARIQIYLHSAFLLPLVLVVVIALGIISRTLLDNQEKSYVTQTRNVSTAFANQLDAYAEGRISQGYLEQEVKKLASDAGQDVSLFNALGRLVIPSQPEIYEKGLLSRYINPDAYVRLIEDREREALLPESLGNLTYKTAYVALNSSEGRLLGVLSVPFYEARSSLEKQVLAVIGSILNTFTTVFLLLLALSYFASRALTVPLRLITQRLRRTNLDRPNEPLDWKSDDEIGLLIGEYNRMIAKLEDSKQALSQSEKQSAWREMAKQVAHEIKNPLTPMKLTLQQLHRILPAENPSTKRLVDKAFSSLIDQIDNISDIANSFADFAKMPVPKNELFDLVPVVQKTLHLYSDDRNINLRTNVRPRSAYVVGDAQLMSRILTNLIINAVQAVPASRKPEIRVSLTTGDEFVVLEVSDNGAGIPEPIRQKVFMPNFSTKDGGNGVGLAVAKRGVEHANGSIWFETSEEKGTTFYISLPLAEVKLPQAIV
jgi:signal transduction histidine kinase